MSVEITPSSQLGFKRPLTRLISETIKIHNPHPHPIAFKVKTTAPKQYCVRPNAGRVESGESVEVQVLLQPLQMEPPPHAKCKDKFLVQSAFITPDEEMRSLTEMWSQTEKTNKAAIQEQKIKVAYLAPEDGLATNGIQEEEEPQESRVLDESYYAAEGYTQWSTKPLREFDEAKFRNGGFSYWETAQLPYVPPVSKAIFSQAQSSPVGHSNGDVRSAPMPATLVPPTSSTPANVPVAQTSHAKQESKDIPSLTSKDIQAVGASPTNIALEDGLAKTTSDSEKLKLALAEIDRLRAQLADAQGPQVTGLRKRGVGATAAADGPAAGAEVALEKVKEAVHSPSGVPIEVVAGLVVGVFVMTYLFF